MSSFQGAGRAVRDLAKNFKWSEGFTLGRPKMLRGLVMDDSYEKERKMTCSQCRSNPCGN